MKVESKSFSVGSPIPGEYALGIPGADGPVPGPNKSPHLVWSEVPEGTRSFAVICHDPDVPSKPDDVNKTDRRVPHDLPRVDFYHWVLVDIPASITELVEGVDASGLVPRGKDPGKTDHGVRGINSYTDWFAGDEQMQGDYGGYDGPWPPFNDERLHHYIFTVYALDVDSLGLPERFGGPEAIAAMQGHILDQSQWVGTYTLNPDAR